jgi:hypothetical protein
MILKASEYLLEVDLVLINVGVGCVACQLRGARISLADELRGIGSFIAFRLDSEFNMLYMTQGKRCGEFATTTTYYNSSACAILG